MFKGLFRERRRSVAVHRLAILGLPAEPVFDRYVDSAALAFNAPIAVLSLIHDHQQTIRASHGLKVDLECVPRSSGFCSYTLDRDDVLEVCDPEADDRFAGLPGVTGDPHVRYYLGAPLRLLSGIDVGALCVADTVHRLPASADQRAYLLGLARQAARTLEARLDIWGDAL
jgi:GAF domain-containing protein